ncbi:MAG: Ig domain-containing protein, partial [Leptospiraceae bacterium]|nr:Ig domain-containing protein [Leptospiraceae bacterium]
MLKILFTLIISFSLFTCNGFLNNEKDKDKKTRNNLIVLGVAAAANQVKPLTIKESYEDGANFALPLKSQVTLTPKSPTSGSKYSIAPNLPAGLSLNADTGEITGSPTEASVQTTYVVTQTKSDGSKLSYTFSIRTGVNVYIDGGSIAIKVGTAVTLYPVKHLNGSSYDISPALPTGLSLDGNTGIISGTASAKTEEIQYTVTQTKPDGDENPIKFAMRVGDESDLADNPGGGGGGNPGGGGLL